MCGERLEIDLPDTDETDPIRDAGEQFVEGLKEREQDVLREAQREEGFTRG